MCRFGLILAFTSVITAHGSQGKDVITGCWPLTIDDAIPFHPPAFLDYPIGENFQGLPAPVDLASHPLASQFRTMLRNAAAAGPNFAGHYVLASWGCGSGCLQFAIVDARNGNVFFPPAIRHVMMTHVMEPEDASKRPRFRRDSALLIVVGATNEGADEGISYYRWTDRELQLIRFLRSEKAASAPG
jgi:hypothetical protein